MSALAVNNEKQSSVRQPSLPLNSLRREIDRLFDTFPGWHTPFGLADLGLPSMLSSKGFDVMPAVDVIEHDKGFEVTAELPGIDEKNIDIKVVDGMLTIKGEKDEKVEETKDHYLSERRFGSFQRSFRLPPNVAADHIEASFAKGVLTVVLPKNASMPKNEKSIVVKPA